MKYFNIRGELRNFANPQNDNGIVYFMSSCHYKYSIYVFISEKNV